MKILDHVTDIPDFPTKGVVFKDISPLLRDKMPELIEHMASLRSWDGIDYIVGIESRGFILGSALAAYQKKGFVPVRKKGKLPPPVVSESYDLEYGSDTLEIKKSDVEKNVVVIDDVLATGGTLKATWKLCEKANLHIKGSMLLMNLSFLNDIDLEKNNIIVLENLS